MNLDEAKYLLAACRSGEVDKSDPAIAPALELARKDPDLGRWLAEQQAFDHAVSQKIKAVPAPKGLKASILQGPKLMLPPSRFQNWRRAVLATAALFTLGLFLVQTFRSPPVAPNDFSQFRNFVAHHLSGGYQRTHLSQSEEDVRKWLKEQGGPSDFGLTRGLARLRMLGCDVVSWYGANVTLVCFQTGRGGAGEQVHLIVLKRTDYPNTPEMGSPQFSQYGDWVIASWSQGAYSFVLGGIGDSETLKKYL
jgi:hypothetical protein